jgi:hypothetical protein
MQKSVPYHIYYRKVTTWSPTTFTILSDYMEYFSVILTHDKKVRSLAKYVLGSTRTGTLRGSACEFPGNRPQHEHSSASPSPDLPFLPK